MTEAAWFSLIVSGVMLAVKVSKMLDVWDANPLTDEQRRMIEADDHDFECPGVTKEIVYSLMIWGLLFLVSILWVVGDWIIS